MTRNSRVELYAAIRRDARAGLSGREIQRKHGVGWRTVQSALTSAWPQQRAAYPTRASKLDGFKPAIDDILRSDLNAPRKQRHTVTRIVDRLRTEFGMDDVSYPVVRAYVATRRPEISIECGRGAPGVFVPQTHLPGREAEVDFGEIGVRLRGQLTTCHLFSLRMSYSGKAVHRASATGGQEAFFEGHVHAFQILGGVPAGKIRYDNLKAAVAQVIGFSRQRVETDRWVAFRSHFDIDAFYCQPGITGAHEKGGVEGDIGRFRRNHLVPVPEVESLHELNELIDSYDQADDRRRIGHRAHTVAESFNAERQLLKPLPVETFETGLWVTPRVDRYSQITVRTNRYSVPSRLIGRQTRVLLNASDLTVYDGRTLVASHERLLTKGGSRLDLDHYLEAFVRKPGALPGATALEQARRAGTFTAAHDAWWAAACKAHGDTDGTRALIEVLLLHRHTDHRHVIAGINAALQAGALTADAVALEARKAAETGTDITTANPPPTDTPAVSSLTQRRLTHLPIDTRPPPSVTAYDQLLRRSTQ
ncbi:IS21 family transposase [Mycolicibacterium arenosum]|uniref:IS21 family transposase n=1 Tax=Mycolicibacterium arenosum TaxID=2952157 RepID=A0ABT1MCA7_9MYCO|nr:IS21 family transposase [Mycolicibacterium sp. CAU 1645]MCP9276804.1 IS21 family transposase [Mycolicibacterium sp. CAU 1645]